MKLRDLLAPAVAGLIFASPAVAQPTAEGEFFVLNALGERGWRVVCDLAQADGDQHQRRERGRGILHADEIALRDVVSGECQYEVPENGMLQLTMDLHRTEFQCPFGAMSDGYCQIQLAPGSRGRFMLRQNGEPSGALWAEYRE